MTTVVTEERLLLAVDRLLYDQSYPAESVPVPPARPDDKGMLDAALLDPNVPLRVLAVKSLGRFESASNLGTLARYLGDRNPTVREEAILAIGLTMRHESGAETAAAEQALENQLLLEKNAAIVAALFSTLGRLRYDAATATRVQKRLAGELRLGADRTPSDERSLLALAALDSIFRNDPRVAVAPEVRQMLLMMAKPPLPAMPVEKALDALIDTSSGNADVAIYASHFHCVYAPSPPTAGRIGSTCDPSGGAKIRLLGVQMMDPRDPTVLPFLEEMARSAPEPRIRAEAWRKLFGSSLVKFDCTSLLETLRDDPLDNRFVKPMLAAIDLVTPKCEQADEIGKQLEVLASLLGDVVTNTKWHVPARALTKLAVFLPDEAKALVHDVASRHEIWQVRAASAQASSTAADEPMLVQLSDDGEPNVRSEAVQGLAGLKSQTVTAAAVRALESDDYQLILVAAHALANTTDRPVAAEALFKTLDRLTLGAKDTSRPARLEILKRLREFSPPDEVGASLLHPFRSNLESYLTDFDPLVAAAAADVLGSLTGRRPQPRPRYRAPEQPTEADLRELKTLPLLRQSPPWSSSADAIIYLSTGEVVYLKLATREAPVTVARFLKLARDGYYDGLTFHRLVPDNFIEGGSPGANDYAGTARFWRDELSGSRHVGGAVGMSRGTERDTGDGQFFIDLADLPALDWEYTVFAHVAPDTMAAVERLLDGAKITRIQVPPQRR